MLDLIKKVLQQVSFDPKLFEKELKKGISRLKQKNEIQQLRQWCHEKFHHQYGGIINNCFALG
ncbi:hypothetical protein FRX97_00110 [Luteibaculum oceani]|uniref:Uncharacterized protein n=1 Tax=Luteibaculum oceani TaxID=1294296 RepID=A0A5C6VK94_9FLAO|nr:hypothetical protein FRX97_00110 [Luteibaculum oceani]